jgi:hypothetical protein
MSITFNPAGYNIAMRFSLRTLLIMVSVLAVALARVGYLKQQRDFHRQEVQKLLQQLAQAHKMREQDVAAQLPDIGRVGPLARGSWVTWNPSESRTPGEAEYERIITASHVAHRHNLLAARFDRAIYRPWDFVWDDPDSVPDVYEVDLRLAVLVPLVVLVMLGAWRMMRNWPRSASRA